MHNASGPNPYATEAAQNAPANRPRRVALYVALGTSLCLTAALCASPGLLLLVNQHNDWRLASVEIAGFRFNLTHLRAYSLIGGVVIGLGGLLLICCAVRNWWLNRSERLASMQT